MSGGATRGALERNVAYSSNCGGTMWCYQEYEQADQQSELDLPGPSSPSE